MATARPAQSCPPGSEGCPAVLGLCRLCGEVTAHGLMHKRDPGGSLGQSLPCLDSPPPLAIPGGWASPSTPPKRVQVSGPPHLSPCLDRQLQPCNFIRKNLAWLFMNCRNRRLHSSCGPGVPSPGQPPCSWEACFCTKCNLAACMQEVLSIGAHFLLCLAGQLPRGGPDLLPW